MRTLGTTGLSVSPVGLGLAALGRPGYINLGHADDLGDDHDVAGAWSAAPTPCSTRPGTAACATSTPRAPTAAPRPSWPRWLRAPRPRPRRRHRRLEVGLHLHRRLAGRRRGARGQGPLASSTLRRQSARRRALLGEHLRALPDPLGHARERRARRRRGARGARRGCASDGLRDRPIASGPRQADDDRARASRPAASTPCRRPGTCSSPRPADALAARARRRAGRDRQGGAGQRAPDRARRRRRAAARRRARARRRRPTRWRWPPSWPSRGRTSSSAARRRSTPAQQPGALDVEWDAPAEEELAALEEPPEEYWERRSELAWN